MAEVSTLAKYDYEIMPRGVKELVVIYLGDMVVGSLSLDAEGLIEWKEFLSKSGMHMRS